jgi:hypothetical protein
LNHPLLRGGGRHVARRSAKRRWEL